jgi:hypothetical protein
MFRRGTYEKTLKGFFRVYRSLAAPLSSTGPVALRPRITAGLPLSLSVPDCQMERIPVFQFKYITKFIN